MAEKKGNQQLGVIVFGEGVDRAKRVAEAKARGFEVILKEDYAELWGDPKKMNTGS